MMVGKETRYDVRSDVLYIDQKQKVCIRNLSSNSSKMKKVKKFVKFKAVLFQSKRLGPH